MAIYGYCRISQKKQNIERQVRNILNAYPTSIIIREAYTGRKIIGRKEWEKIYRTVKPGDLIVFDSVSRFSRNAEEGFELYQDLYYKSVDLVFLKEPQINTETFKRALDRAIPMTGTNVDYILDGINKFLLELAKDQIRLAFEQAEKEVEDLRQRTREGIETARLNGKQIGACPGKKHITKKSIKVCIFRRPRAPQTAADVHRKRADCAPPPRTLCIEKARTNRLPPRLFHRKSGAKRRRSLW